MSKPEVERPSERHAELKGLPRPPAGDPGDPRATQHLDLATIQAINQAAAAPPSTGGDPPPQPTLRPRNSGAARPPLRVEKVDLPVEAAGQTSDPPSGDPQVRPALRRATVLWGGGSLLLGALVLLGVRSLKHEGPGFWQGKAPQTGSLGDLGNCLEQARSGNPHAMRMLGAMYYYGLNVPQDREKGLYWYRKAAAAGSEAAQAELSKLAGGR